MPLAFDPLSPDFARDPYPYYAALRETPGLTCFEDFDIWLAARFEDVGQIALHPAMVRSLEGLVLGLSPAIAATSLYLSNAHSLGILYKNAASLQKQQTELAQALFKTGVSQCAKVPGATAVAAERT